MLTYISGFVLLMALPYSMPALLLQMAGVNMKKVVVKDNERIEMLDLKKTVAISTLFWAGIILIISLF